MIGAARPSAEGVIAGASEIMPISSFYELLYSNADLLGESLFSTLSARVDLLTIVSSIVPTFGVS